MQMVRPGSIAYRAAADSGLAAPLVLALLLALGLLLAGPASANERVILDVTSDRVPLGEHLSILRDESGQLTAADILSRRDGWIEWHKQSVSLGMDRADHWFKVELTNQAPFPQDFLLEIAYPSLDQVNVLVARNGTPISRFEMGDRLTFDKRPINHHYFVTPLRWNANETLTLLIQVKTEGVLQLPLTLWREGAFASYDQSRQLVSGMYFGIMGVMLIYNLFMFMGIGDRSYLYYVGFVMALPLFVSSLLGYSFQYFWPDAPAWNGKSIGLFLSITMLFAGLFTNNFLQLQRPDKPAWIRYGFRIMMGLSVVMIASVFVLDYNSMLRFVIISSVAACAAALTVGIHGWMQKEPPARFYVLAWTSLLVGGIILAGNKFSIIPQTPFTDNAVQLGSSLLVVLLSFAMVERINEEKRKRFRAQMQSLKAEKDARAAEQKALQIQKNANRQLEAKVKERTEELARANAELQELSARDALTGLYNRRYLDEILVREYTRCYRNREPVALILLDIDHFKRFNDTYGHLVGDDCLRIVAQAVHENATRASDTVARYGGEEFCVLLPDTDLPGALAVAERIREAVEKLRFRVAGKRVPVTISLGVTSQMPSDAEQWETLVMQADEALYQSKEAGRNRVSGHSAGYCKQSGEAQPSTSS